MKVHLIKLKTIQNYTFRNRNSISGFTIWQNIISKADWESPKDIIAAFGNADILGKGSDRVVFNIGGNKYRMIYSYYFGNQNVHLYINWIGTHSEYDKICDKNLQYTISKY